jgi:hypothetical protein
MKLSYLRRFLFRLSTVAHVVAGFVAQVLAPGEAQWRRELEEISKNTMSNLNQHLSELQGLVSIPLEGNDAKLRRICQLTRYIVVRGAELDAETSLLRLCRFWQDPEYAWHAALAEKTRGLMGKAVECVKGTRYEANCSERLEYVVSCIPAWCREGEPARDGETVQPQVTRPAV